jgi:hypothetical protein
MLLVWRNRVAFWKDPGFALYPSGKSNMYLKTRIEHWNDTDGGKRKYRCSERNLSQCYFVHHKSHVD